MRRIHNSTGRNLSDTESPSTLLKFTVALYFHLCDSVSLSHVTVTNSFCMGVIMYDTTGKNLISNSVFSNNVAQDRITPGGGGFCIEFTYSTPGELCDRSSLHHNTSLVPRPNYPQLRMDYITATLLEGLVKCLTKVVPRLGF